MPPFSWPKNRANVEEAYPGDVIGIHNHGTIKIGDTFTEKETPQIYGHSQFRAGAFQAHPSQKTP